MMLRRDTFCHNSNRAGLTVWPREGARALALRRVRRAVQYKRELSQITSRITLGLA